MRKIEKELNNKKINYGLLEEYGFILNNNIYKYEKNILDNKFKVIINIDKDIITSKLIELSLDDEYLLADAINTTGEFIGTIKKEYNKVINDFIDKCTINNIFKNKQSIKIINYIKDKYNDELEFLWNKFPKTAIWRNKDNNKWYGIIMEISKKKLDIDSDELVEIIDIMYDKDKINNIIDNNKIYPGYHMNKKSWITIILDNRLDTKYILELINNSYKISIAK